MAIRVSDCAHAHTTDIDPELKLDSKEWDRMANVCVSRATTAMSRDAPGYSELQRHQIEDIFNSMMAMSVAAKKGTKMAAKWPPASGAVRSEPFPLLRSVVRNGPEPSRARRC
jgi:hypothetical protein